MTTGQLIPAAHADVYWNDADEALVDGASILVLDSRQIPGSELLKRRVAKYSSSAGSHVMGWMADDHPFMRPEGLFINVWVDRGCTKEAMSEVLEEFAKIEECEWARTMLAAFELLND